MLSLNLDSVIYSFEKPSQPSKPPSQGYTMSASLEAAPGDVVSETKHTTTYKGATASTFEGDLEKRCFLVRYFEYHYHERP